MPWERCFVMVQSCGVLTQWHCRGSEAHIVLLPSRIKWWGYIILLEFIPLHHVILLKVLLRSYELNTLDACWIAVDVWSNSSRCRSFQSTWHGRDAYIHDHCLRYRHNFVLFYQLLNSNLFTHHMLSSREKLLVKTMAPGNIFIILFSDL